jgi:glycosyltransferase involved in cell wall biosynthesis
MNWPLVTIGIPTFNRADQYLKEAIESAVKQTYPNLEIIVSDNCSSDDTGQIVESFNNSRIRYHRHDKNIGGNANFNFCLKQAKGAFFLLLHDDDLIDNDFIETCINAIGDRHEIGIVRTGTREIDQNGNVLIESPNTVDGLSNEELYRQWFAWKTSLYLCSTLFNTRRLIEIGGFQSKHNLFQDVLAEFQVAARHGRIDIFDVKASFRKHPGAETLASEVDAWCEDSAFLLDSICTLATKYTILPNLITS